MLHGAKFWKLLSFSALGSVLWYFLYWIQLFYGTAKSRIAESEVPVMASDGILFCPLPLCWGERGLLLKISQKSILLLSRCFQHPLFPFYGFPFGSKIQTEPKLDLGQACLCTPWEWKYSEMTHQNCY